MSSLSFLYGGHLKSYNKFVAEETCSNDAAIVYQYMIDKILEKKWNYKEVSEFDVFDICETCYVSKSQLIDIFETLKECEFIYEYEISNFVDKAFCIIRLDYLQKLMGL